MGATRRRARAKSGRPDHCGSAGRVAELGSAGLVAGPGRPSDLGVARRPASSGAACTGRPGPSVERTCRSNLGRACRPCEPASRCARTNAAGGADLGRASASATFRATAGTTGGCCELGRNRCSARSDLGRTAACSARTTSGSYATGAAPIHASSAGCCRPAPCSRADVGIAPRRDAGARGTSRRWLGSSRAVMGRSPASRAIVRSGRARLGNAGGKRSAGSASCAFLERACRRVVLGRTQDRRTCSSPRAVLGRAIGVACRPPGLVSPGSCGAAATGRGLGASTGRTGPAAGLCSWFDHVGRACRGRRNSSGSGGTCRTSGA